MLPWAPRAAVSSELSICFRFAPFCPLQSSESENTTLLPSPPEQSHTHPILHISVSRGPRSSSLPPCLRPCVWSVPCFWATMLLFTGQAPTGPVCPAFHSMPPAPYFPQNSTGFTAISINSHNNLAKQAWLTFSTNYLPGLCSVFPFVKHKSGEGWKPHSGLARQDD